MEDEIYIIEKNSLTSIADEIRTLSDTADNLSLNDMTSNVAEANNEVDTQAELITQIASVLEDKVITGSRIPTLQDKTVTPTTDKQTVTADLGYDGLDIVTVKAMPTTTQAIPDITVDSKGLITASAIQEDAGYITAGMKSATMQLPTAKAKTITPNTTTQTAIQSEVYAIGDIIVNPIPSDYIKPTSTKAATTYTPSTSDQTIAAGTYCSGKQTISGDADLKSSNIKSGVTIFGVTGTYTPSLSLTDVDFNLFLTDSTTAKVTLTTPDGYDGISSATVQADVLDGDLKAENIKSGVSILGIKGTYTATAPYNGPYTYLGTTDNYNNKSGDWGPHMIIFNGNVSLAQVNDGTFAYFSQYLDPITVLVVPKSSAWTLSNSSGYTGYVYEL